jgi:hypothetical protein
MEATHMSETPWVVFLIPIVAIIGGFVIAGLGTYGQIRRREFEHRERLAMIEKGVAPAAAPPKAEADGILPTTSDVFAANQEPREARLRRGGFIVMAVGFGLGFMLWMTAHEEGAATGVGGFLVILGAAIFVSSFLGGRASAGTRDTSGGSRR